MMFNGKSKVKIKVEITDYDDITRVEIISQSELLESSGDEEIHSLNVIESNV